MRSAYLFGDGKVTVFDQGSDNVVWSKKFDSYQDAAAFLVSAGWSRSNLGHFPIDCVTADTWHYTIRYEHEPYTAIPSVEVVGYTRYIVSQVVHVIENTQYHKVWCAVVERRAGGWAFVYRDALQSTFDPVLTLVIPAPIKVGAIGIWNDIDLTLSHGMKYFCHLKELYGELFDEALRAHILRNYSGDSLRSDRGVDPSGGP